MKISETFTAALIGSALGRILTYLLPGRELYVMAPLFIGVILFWVITIVRLGLKIYRNACQAQKELQEVELKRLCVPPRGAALHHTGKPFDQLTDAEWNNGADENGYLSR